MAFIISKKSERYGQIRNIYYLVENYREGKKVKRRTLLSLGEYTNLSQFLDATEKKEADLLQSLSEDEKILDNYLKTGKYSSIFPWQDPPGIVKKRLIGYVEQARNDIKACQMKIAQIKSFM